MGNDMSDDNFGPWIDWAGGPCPIPDAKAGEFEVKRNNGSDHKFKHLMPVIFMGGKLVLLLPTASASPKPTFSGRQ